MNAITRAVLVTLIGLAVSTAMATTDTEAANHSGTGGPDPSIIPTLFVTAMVSMGLMVSIRDRR